MVYIDINFIITCLNDFCFDLKTVTVDTPTLTLGCMHTIWLFFIVKMTSTINKCIILLLITKNALTSARLMKDVNNRIYETGNSGRKLCRTLGLDGKYIEECCPGYATSNKTGEGGFPSCTPICDPPCVNGECTEPDFCECYDGYRKDNGVPFHMCLATCDPPCVNAYCVEIDECVCKRGYTRTNERHVCQPVAAILRGGVFTDDLSYNKDDDNNSDNGNRFDYSTNARYSTNPDVSNNFKTPDMAKKFVSKKVDLSNVYVPNTDDENGYTDKVNQSDNTDGNDYANHAENRTSSADGSDDADDADGPGSAERAAGTSGCRPRCGPFAVCAGRRCVCVEGYAPSARRPGDCEPRCTPPCGEREMCVSPQVCDCEEGFQRSPDGVCVNKCNLDTTWHPASQSCREKAFSSESSTPQTISSTNPSLEAIWPVSHFPTQIEPSTTTQVVSKEITTTNIPLSIFCAPPCVYGHCMITGVCNCRLGWTGISCAKPCPLRNGSLHFDFVVCPEMEHCFCLHPMPDGHFCFPDEKPICTTTGFLPEPPKIKQPKWLWCVVALSVVGAAVLVVILPIAVLLKMRYDNRKRNFMDKQIVQGPATSSSCTLENDEQWRYAIN